MVEKKITVGTKFPLDGLLTTPEIDEDAFPAIVLVHGSGPNDMDEKVGNCYTFKDMAAGFANRGIATIRYNKRTKTYGKQMVKGPDGSSLTVWDETIEDAIFATDIIKKDPRINPEKVFIAGHSMGAMLAPRIDAEGGNYAGIILLAGSPRRLEEIMIEQQDNAIKDLNPVLKWIAGKQMKKIREKFDMIYKLSDEEAKNTNFLGKYNKIYYLKEWGLKPAVDYLKEWGLKPAVDYLKDLTKPILVMQGDKDFHVSVENDFNKYKEILGDRPNASFKLYPGLNHLFMPTVYGTVNKAMKEYKVPQHVEEYVIDDIADWVKGC